MTLHQSFTGVFDAGLATSFVFGVFHGTLTQCFIGFFAGIMFCFIFEATGNMDVCINAQLI